MRLPSATLAGLLVVAATTPVGCSAPGPTNLGSVDPTGGSLGSSSGSGGSGGGGGNAGSVAGNGSGGTNIIPPSGGTSGTGEGGACAQAESQATLVKEPIDIIVVLDNSGSMDEELEAVESNINVNFAGILDDSDTDYRVILISRHRKEARDFNEEASTSICVEAPLSGLMACPAPDPVFSDRFFQYFTKIESDDSFDVTLDTYEPPFESDREDRADQAPEGWSAWLRPRAKKVFLEMTDFDEDMSAAEFVSELQAMAPENFGTDPEDPNFVFHSIVGVVEKAVETEPYLPNEPVTDVECSLDTGGVGSTGTTYQELSILTGGLRFPICSFDGYDVVFRHIANDVVTRTQVACDFAIPPPPPGKDLELEKVAVHYTSGNGTADQEFLQARTPTDCGPDAFYIEGSTRIVLCPEACTFVQADEMARVDVLFTCESTIIVR
jgi:hypothetical protein